MGMLPTSEIISTLLKGCCCRFEKLIDLNLAIIRYLMDCLQIQTQLVLLSDLEVKARGTQLLIEICKVLGASAFLAQSQAKKYLDVDHFQKEGIELRCFRYVPPIYPQLWGEFLANLSTIDLLFNCGPKAHDMLMRHQPVARS